MDQPGDGDQKELSGKLENIYQEYDQNVTTEPKKPVSKILTFGVIASVVTMVLAGLAVAFFFGFFISFGNCFGDPDCSVVYSSAPISLSILSLFITIPISILILANYRK